VLDVKIGSIRQPERYAVRRIVTAAHCELQAEMPGLEMNITELGEPGQIGKYALVLVLPTLVIDEKVVCSGRFPAKEEVKGWMRQAATIDAKKGAC
jgi:hypothetical protein